jgi:hypothetical protein
MPYLTPTDAPTDQTSSPPPQNQAYVPPPPPPPPPQQQAPPEQAPPQQAAPSVDPSLLGEPLSAAPQQHQQVQPSIPTAMLGEPLSAAPAETAQAQPTSTPPQDSGKATDALGATVAQIPGALLSGPAKTVEAAKAAPGAVQEFAGAGGRKAVYRPAPEGTAPELKGENQGAIDAARANSDAQLQKVASGDVGNIGNLLGSIKDVGLAHLSQNMGEPLPWGPDNRRAEMEAAYQVLKTGQWPDWATQPQIVGPNGTPLSTSFQTNYENDPSLQGILNATGQDKQNFIDAYEKGYTDDDNVIHSPGPDAMWYWKQAGLSGAQKAAADITSDPVGTLGNIAADTLTAGGESLLTTGGEQAARGLERNAARDLAGKALVGTARVGNAVQTMGLSEAVPLAFKGASKAFGALPWLGKQTEGAAQAQAVRDITVPAGEVLANRRAGVGQPGVPDLEPPTHITQPTADPRIGRVTIPEDASNPPIDVTYHVDKDGKLNGIYDTAIPGPGERYRPPTAADMQQIYDAWQRLPDADRQALRRATFPRMSRVETSPGEPFIEQGAERYTDVMGNPVDSGRIGTGYERELQDLRGSILRSANPDHILTDFRTSWETSLYDGRLHPLTRRPLAESRLQTLRDVLDGLPASYRTSEREGMYRQMRDMLPKDPPPIGTGLRWEGPLSGKTPGRMVPLKPRETQWLGEMAQAPLTTFKKKSLDAGRVGGKNGLNVIFDRKPPTTAPPAFHNGYTAYLDLMEHRTKSPAGGRAQLADLQGEVNGLRKSPTPSAQARVDAIKDVFERGGFVPGASGMTDDEFTIAAENYLRTTRPTFPPLPGAASTPPHGTFPAGSQDELWGMSLTDPVRDALDTHIDIGGTARTAGQRLFTHWEETETAYRAAQRQAKGLPLDAGDQRLLDSQVKKISGRFQGNYKNLTATKLAAMQPGEIDRISAALLGSDIQTSQGVRSATGKLLTPAERSGFVGKYLLAPYDNFLAKWRSTVLYNVARGVQYPMLQAAGNLVTLGIANRGAIPFYLSPTQWPKAWKYLRDPETASLPSIIDHLDRVGLGRHENLGRVSRDQLGARTGFNMEGSHPFTKAAGKVLGNQSIKDLGDTFDLQLRHALFGAVFEPAYKRLKNDIAPMADATFQRMSAARGIPLTVSRTQLDNAVRSLEGATGGYFNQAELRQSLYEAMGGASAANQQFTRDAADRVARDYHGELRTLRDVADTEVDRVAFAGGDTNLEAVLQRGALFTWWIARASRLYLTEAAQSPIQMGIWARAIDAGNQRERAGTSPAYKNYVDFMQTPAGYTVSLNPFSLAGSWILGSSADPTDARANLTALGQLTEGGIIGDNLVLSPVLRALGQSLGAFGQDARTPDVLGTNRLEREITDALNYVNEHWVQFNSTKGGNPERVPNLGFSQGMINFLAQRMSGILPGTQQVAGFDPNAGPEAQISNLVAEQVLRDNPDLDPNDAADADTLRRRGGPGDGRPRLAPVSGSPRPLRRLPLPRPWQRGPGVAKRAGWGGQSLGGADLLLPPAHLPRRAQPAPRPGRVAQRGRRLADVATGVQCVRQEDRLPGRALPRGPRPGAHRRCRRWRSPDESHQVALPGSRVRQGGRPQGHADRSGYPRREHQRLSLHRRADRLAARG